ncbi:MAG: FMN-binding protein, partial [Candidatus Calescibacterium sp.]
MLFLVLMVLGETLSSDKIMSISRSVFPAYSYFEYVELEISDYDKFISILQPVKPSVDEKLVSAVLVRENQNSQKISGFCAVLNEIGKEMPITFLVCISREKEVPEVSYIDVLVYRETRGGEIRSKLFLKQFFGKSEKDPVSVGKDIRNIKGATLSAWATTRVVKKALAISKGIDLGFVKVKSRKEISFLPSHSVYSFSKCYTVGDSYLCVDIYDFDGDFSKLDKFNSFIFQISSEFESFYFSGSKSQKILSLIRKYEILRDFINIFDIYWRGYEKPDLGGVWKGYVVDVVKDFLFNQGFS